MSKISINSDGVTPYTSSNSKDFIEELNKAINACNFDVPNDCAYKDWIHDLRNSLTRCRENVEQTERRLNTINSQATELSESSVNRIKLFEPIRIKANERLIK